MRKERKNGHPDSDADNVRFTIPYDLVGNVLLPLDGTASVFPKDIEDKARLHQPPFPAAPVIGWILMLPWNEGLRHHRTGLHSDYEDAVFPVLHTGDEGLRRIPHLWLQQERAVLADRDAAFCGAADSLGLHAVLNTEDGMSHNK